MDALVQNIDQLRTQVQRLIHQNDQKGAAQKQKRRIRIQQAIQQRGNQAEGFWLRPVLLKGLVNEDADRWMKWFLS